MSGGAGGGVKGFKYLFGIHMGIGRGPVDELIEIKVGDKTAWRGSIVDNGQTEIDEPELFGGTEKEGGIVGTFTTMFGRPDQIADPALGTVLKAPMPGFRGKFTAFFDGIISMNNPYPKPWKFRVRRALQGWDGDPWYPEKAVISLVRQVSAAEVDASFVHTSVPTSETLTTGHDTGIHVNTESHTMGFAAGDHATGETFTLAPVGPWTVTIMPPGALVSIDSIYTTVQLSNGDAGPVYGNFYYVAGLDYSVTGNVITFLDRGLPLDYASRVIRVDYTFHQAVDSPLSVMISPPDTLLSVDEVYTIRTFENESGFFDSKLTFVAGLDYTVAGNVITFIERGLPVVFFGLLVHVKYTFNVVRVDPLSVTLSPPGALLSVDQIYTTRVFERESGPIEENYYFEAGLDYSVAGNVITFIERGLPVNLYNIVIHVAYTYDLVTLSPNADIEGVGQALIKAMNPVHIIYEALTNRAWGRGLDRSLLDDAAWRFAADQCFSEQLGLCIRWTRRDEVKTFVQTVLDHIAGVMHEDRKTGAIRIKLIRGDYVKANLPLYDEDHGLLEIRENAVSTLSAMVNEVRVVYRDPVTDDDRTVRASNLASIQAAGGAINSITKTYPGLPTAELASRMAQWTLRCMSPIVRRFTIVLDRRGYHRTPGGVLRVQSLSRGIPDMVLRIGTVDYGKLGEGKIVIQAAQDVFAFPQRGFTTIGPPQWNPVNNQPCIGLSVAFEMPYRSMYRAMSAADLAFIDPASAYLGVVVQEGKPLNTVFNIAVRTGAIEPEDIPPDTSAMCVVP